MLYFPLTSIRKLPSGRRAQVVRRSLLVQEVWGSNSEPI